MGGERATVEASNAVQRKIDPELEVSWERWRRRRRPEEDRRGIEGATREVAVVATTTRGRSTWNWRCRGRSGGDDNE
jgi:hypothetical protein